MSEDISVVAIRGRIPEMDGKTESEVLTMFREKLGEPDEIDEFNGKIDRFEYTPEKHDFVSVFNYDNKEWGIQKVLVKGPPFEVDDTNIDVDEILVIKERMQKLFPTITRVTVAVYTYYNGTDEPISFYAKASTK